MPEPSAPAPVPRRHTTGWLLQAAHRLARSALSAELASVGLTPPHFGVLLQLALHQPLSQRQLVDALLVDRTAMVRLLDDLQGRGLVERRPSVTDRRVNAVVLTAAGQRAFAETSELARQVSDEVFGVLSADEQKQLNTLLDRIVAHAQKRSTSGDRRDPPPDPYPLE